MPPHFPVEDDSYETKEWASATIDTLFSDNHPITFEPCKPIQVLQDHEKPIAKSVQNLKECTSSNPARRSLSMLETRLFNRHPTENNSGRPWARSIQSDTVVTLVHSDSAPSLLMPQHHQRSFSNRFKRSIIPERPTQKRTMTFKEKEGIDIWKTTFSQYLAEGNKTPHGQSPHLLHFILNELISTETTYLEHLLIIKQMFMDPLIEAATVQPRPLVNLRDIETIFAFIPELISLSSTLVQRLNDAICTTEDGETQGYLGQVFCDLEDEFEIYIGYATNFSKQQRCIIRADRSIVYRQLVQDSLRKKETNRMGLSDYMIAPIQRITRYGLLLKDLSKHSDPTSPDFPFIQRSLKCHLALAHAMNAIQ